MSCNTLQVFCIPMLWTCTTVQQERGLQLGSAWHALISQLQLLVMWLSLREAKRQVHCKRIIQSRMEGSVFVWHFFVVFFFAASGDFSCCCCNLELIHAGPAYSKVVDFYNSATSAWSTAELSIARFGLAAASAGNFAIFAGGTTHGLLWSIDDALKRRMLLCHLCSLLFGIFCDCISSL